MSRTTFKILNLPEFLEDVRVDVNYDIFFDKLDKSLQFSREQISNHIYEAIEDTNTWQLLFSNASNIDAELGYTQDELFDFQQDLIDLIRETVSVESFVRRVAGKFAAKNNPNATIFLNISFNRFESQLRELPSISFISKGGFEIPWLQWILDGGSVDGYKILFDVNGNISRFSRTGKAIMVKSESSSWSTDNLGLEGDFIEEAISSPNLAENIARTIEENISYV